MSIFDSLGKLVAFAESDAFTQAGEVLATTLQELRAELRRIRAATEQTPPLLCAIIASLDAAQDPIKHAPLTVGDVEQVMEMQQQEGKQNE